MFEELEREVRKLSQPQPIRIDMPLDDKGYFDRRCPAETCRGNFKVLFQNWEERVREKAPQARDPGSRRRAAALMRMT